MPFLLRDLFFTPSCINCTKIGVALCRTCADRTHVEFRPDLAELSSVTCAGEYSGWLRDRVIHYKSGNHQLGRGLAELIFAKFADQLKNSILVPIPSSQNKLVQRQIDLVGNLAKFLTSFEPTLKLKPLLQLTKEISDQVGLTQTERFENLKDAFIGTRNISGPVVVLDDVVTTGATITSAAKALKAAGATSVSAIGLCAATKLH